MGSIALRALRLWRETVNERRIGADEDVKSLETPEEKLDSMVDVAEPAER